MIYSVGEIIKPLMTYTLPPLGFDYAALEPHIDARTMEIHYTKHHQAYVDNLNKALAETGCEDVDLKELLKDLGKLPEDKRMAVRNNGGGHLNHSMFWKTLLPGGAKEPVGTLKEAIEKSFGSFEKLRELMNQGGLTRFGSGWSWLSVDTDKNLKVHSSANQDSPLMEGMIPILGIDVWEHAYYLHYQNRRADYLGAIWNVINWDTVENFYQSALK